MLRSREMETFLAVAEELHFGRAAERLHLSTSGASQAVRSLERWIGAPLSLVPITGHPPFVCRAIWLAAKETAEIRRFAEIAATAG